MSISLTNGHVLPLQFLYYISLNISHGYLIIFDISVKSLFWLISSVKDNLPNNSAHLIIRSFYIQYNIYITTRKTIYNIKMFAGAGHTRCGSGAVMVKLNGSGLENCPTQGSRLRINTHQCFRYIHSAVAGRHTKNHPRHGCSFSVTS